MQLKGRLAVAITETKFDSDARLQEWRYSNITAFLPPTSLLPCPPSADVSDRRTRSVVTIINGG
jgi:hypothetical protein